MAGGMLDNLWNMHGNYFFFPIFIGSTGLASQKWFCNGLKISFQLLTYCNVQARSGANITGGGGEISKLAKRTTPPPPPL